jgi:hypothetical protein
MGTYRCGTCGKEHDELPMDLSYQRPADYFKIPEDERTKRVWMNADSNADLCLIDNKEFYLRGVLALPVPETRAEFRFGVGRGLGNKTFDAISSYGRQTT